MEEGRLRAGCPMRVIAAAGAYSRWPDFSVVLSALLGTKLKFVVEIEKDLPL
jgi:hypothetical protein